MFEGRYKYLKQLMSFNRKIKRKIFFLSLLSTVLFLWFFAMSVHSFSLSAMAEDDNKIESFNAGAVTQEQKIVSAVATPAAVTVVSQSVSDVPSSLPWYITRAAAITAYLLLFFLIVMGEGMASGVVYGYITPVHAWIIHKYLAISFGIALLTHMISLLFDSFISFGIWDVLVPFHAVYKPFFVGLGTVGFYLTVLILVSSLFSRFQHSSWWRKLHFLVYPLFLIGLVHGLSTGTDSGSIFMLLLYVSTGIIFGIVIFQRWKLSLSRR